MWNNDLQLWPVSVFFFFLSFSHIKHNTHYSKDFYDVLTYTLPTLSRKRNQLTTNYKMSNQFNIYNNLQQLDQQVFQLHSANLLSHDYKKDYQIDNKTKYHYISDVRRNKFHYYERDCWLCAEPSGSLYNEFQFSHIE